MIYIFYHITDVHYYSKRNYTYDYVNAPQANTEICMRASEEAFKKALDIIAKDSDTNTAIITGDLTNHGESYSHEEVTALLKEATDNGLDLYVVTDSHDYPNFKVHDIDENGKKIPAKEHLPREEVVPMYYPYGRNKGFDSFSDDTTYIAEILPGLYYAALGYDFAPEGRGSVFSDELMAWVKNHAEKIKAKGGVLVCGTHRPIITPSPAYSVMGKGNTFYDGEKRIREFADMGVKLFFSGHTHIQCMKEVVSDKGNKIYSVQTSSLAGFPPKMRKITIDTDKGTVDISTIDIDLPELNLGMSFTEYARKGFLGIIESIPYNMEHDIEAFLNTDGGISLPKDLILKFPKVVMFLGRKLNGLTYGKVAKFSKKYHDLTKKDLEGVKDKKFVELVFTLVSNLYRGNAAFSPDTPEYKIVMGTMKKIQKLLSTFRVDIKNTLCGYTLTEFVEPLLYNSGLDDDNVSLKVDFT
jgi:3',5'-cyclic AMP phosphodiesterase CpdA